MYLGGEAAADNGAGKFKVSGPLAGLATLLLPAAIPIIVIASIQIGAPGNKTPFAFLDGFYPPYVNEQKALANVTEAKAAKEKAAKDAAAKEAAAKEAAAKEAATK